MEKLDEVELYETVGGGFSGAIINAFLSAGKFIYGLGQAFGSGLRRIGTNNLCPIR